MEETKIQLKEVYFEQLLDGKGQPKIKKHVIQEENQQILSQDRGGKI